MTHAAGVATLTAMLGFRRGRAAARRSTSYRMRERLLSLGDSFAIEDAAGKRVLEVDQKLFRPLATFKLRDARGKEVATVRRRLFRFHETMAVERDGRVVAEVRRRRWNPVSEQFDVVLGGRKRLLSTGSSVHPAYRIERNGRAVASVVKAVARIRDTYDVEIARGQDPPLLLAIAVAINRLSHTK